MAQVSIIIPTYNRPLLLPRAVTSALDACPPDGEVIVVDDQSDTAIAALEQLAGDPRLRVVTNDGDKGAAGARNYGVSLAMSDIIMFLDDDDQLIADYPARVLAVTQTTNADFGFSNIDLVGSADAAQDAVTALRHPRLRTGLLAPQVPLGDKMPGLSYGFWIRRKVFDDIGGINAAQVVDEDGDLFCRLYGLGHACWFEEMPGCVITRDYDVPEGSAPQLSNGTAAEIEAECRMQTYQRNQHYFGWLSPDRWFLIRRILRHTARNGLDPVARDLLRDLSPVTWRLKGWLFWRIKKLGRR